MASEGAPSKYDAQALLSLVPYNDLLEERNGKVYVPHPLEVPLDEYGVPTRIKETIDGIIGTMKNPGYKWTGIMSVHHMLTPARWYLELDEPDYALGKLVREHPKVKVEVPLQTHNAIHLLYNVPRMPHPDVLHEIAISCNNLMCLKKAVSARHNSPLESLHSALEMMKDDELGWLPSVEVLGEMNIQQARQAIYSLARVKRMPQPSLIHPGVLAKAA